MNLICSSNRINFFLFMVITVFLSVLMPSNANKPQLFTIEAGSLSKQSGMITNNKSIKSSLHIRMNADAFQSEEINVPLPNGEYFGIKCLSVRQDSLGYTIWYGESENDKSENFTIVEKNGKFNGSIHHQGKIFDISPTTQPGDHVFVETDFSSKRDCVKK
jgi:hypothetical protein